MLFNSRHIDLRGAADALISVRLYNRVLTCLPHITRTERAGFASVASGSIVTSLWVWSAPLQFSPLTTNLSPPV